MSESIVITGATGVIGRRAVAELVRAGHLVSGVTRSARGRATLERLGATAVEADVFDQRDLAAAFAGATVVVNLLTHIPAADQMGVPGAWDENDRLRTHASLAVARAATAAGAARLVQESVAFVYADGGTRWLDEDARVAGAGPTSTALVAEDNARDAFDGDTVVLRFGVFVGPDSALSRANLTAARDGESPFPAPPGAYVPTVWLDDAGRAVAAALRLPAGTYNVVDDDPPTRAEVDAALAAAVGRTRLADPVYAADNPQARSLRLSNRRMRRHGGWAPRVRGGVDGWHMIAVQRAMAA